MLITKTKYLVATWLPCLHAKYQTEFSTLLRDIFFSKRRFNSVLKGQYHAVFSNTLKIKKTLFG